jgi:serine/threonine-protein kinase RsbT
MKKLCLSDMDQQKILVSVSELTRNIISHAHSKGSFHCEQVDQGIRLTVSDEGPGIHNIQDILNGKRVSSSLGLGLGLSGVRRLMDEFDIETSRKGTKVIATKWIGRKKERF